MSAPLALILSPQPWDGFQVSKHHYARALAGRGWRVVFVDPPADLGRPGRIVQAPTGVPGVTSLRYQTAFPYRLKFHLRPLFDLLMRRQARRLVAATGRPDLVWDFDNAYQFRDLTAFGARATVFHLVDDVGRPGLGTKGAYHVLYLHPSFCARAGGTPDPANAIGHGLGAAHARAAAAAIDRPRPAGPPHLGFVGNLAAEWLDWDAVAEILHRRPDARLTCWGPLPAVSSAALAAIRARPGTRFPGLTPPERILDEAADIDLWLAPFRADRLPGGALDSHKILEYLATGRAVASITLTAHADNPLVAQPDAARDESFADLVVRLLADPAMLNPPELATRRRAFALERSYDRRLDQVLARIGLAPAAAGAARCNDRAASA